MSKFFLPLLAQRHLICHPCWQQPLGSQTTPPRVSSLLCISAASPLYRGSRRPGWSTFSSRSGITKKASCCKGSGLITSLSVLALPLKMAILKGGSVYFKMSHVVSYLVWHWRPRGLFWFSLGPGQRSMGAWKWSLVGWTEPTELLLHSLYFEGRFIFTFKALRSSPHTLPSPVPDFGKGGQTLAIEKPAALWTVAEHIWLNWELKAGHSPVLTPFVSVGGSCTFIWGLLSVKAPYFEWSMRLCEQIVPTCQGSAFVFMDAHSVTSCLSIYACWENHGGLFRVCCSFQP